MNPISFLKKPFSQFILLIRLIAFSLLFLKLFDLITKFSTLPPFDKILLCVFRPGNNGKIDGCILRILSFHFDTNSGAFEADHRLVYPALSSGEGQEVAGNGPFPWVLLLIDENESPDNYMLISTRIAQRGTMVYIHSELTTENTPDFQSLMDTILDVRDWMHEANKTHEIVLGMYGAIDENHWGLIGHGYGATWASNVFINWENFVFDETIQPRDYKQKMKK